MLRAEVWITTTLITLGIIGAMIYNWPRYDETQKRGIPTPHEAAGDTLEGKPLDGSWEGVTHINAPSPLPPVSIERDHVEEGDKFLVVGNYPASQRAYFQAMGQLKENAPCTLLLRLAICAEQMESLDAADSFYRRTIQQSRDNIYVRLLGLAGVARVLQGKRQLDEAHELLSELFLRYGTLEQTPSEIRSQVSYQLSTVVEQLYQELHVASSGVAPEFEFNWCEPNIEAMLELAEETLDEVEFVPEPPTSIEVTMLQRPSEDIRLMAVNTTTPLVHINEVLIAYAEQARIIFDVSPKAKEVLAGSTTKLNVSTVALSLVIDNVLSPLEITWEQTGERVSIRHNTEGSNSLLQYRFDQANRALRNIELTLPNELRRESSILHRANLIAMNSNFDSAAKEYQNLLKADPNGELEAKLSYNLAMLALKSNEPSTAINRLYFAVDQSLNQSFQAKCYDWIGRLELDRSRAERAVYAASRGLSLATEKLIRQRILMTLAKAYLLENEPFAANRVLFNNADDIQEPTAQRMAAVLGAYARFLGTTPTEGLRNEGERMVIALSAIGKDDMPNFIDKLIVGRAFFEVGFTSRSVELLHNAMELAPHEDWRRRITLELGMSYFRSGEMNEAEGVFALIQDEKTDETSLIAQHKLAEIALIKKEPRRCLELCQRLWELSLNETQKADILSMMGRSYRRLGQHHVAAVCFSGMVPHKSNQIVDSEVGTPNLPEKSGQGFQNNNSN